MLSRIGSFSLLLAVMVLLPFLVWEESIEQLTGGLLNNSSTQISIAAVIILLLALDSLLPTPSSIVSAAAALYFGFFVGALIIFIGMTLGVIIGYMVGAQLIRIPHLNRIMKDNDVKRMNRWSDRYGLLSLSLTRPIPVLAEVSVMLAGATNVPSSRVVLYTLPANGIVAFGYSFLSLIAD